MVNPTPRDVTPTPPDASNRNAAVPPSRVVSEEETRMREASSHISSQSQLSQPTSLVTHRVTARTPPNLEAFREEEGETLLGSSGEELNALLNETVPMPMDADNPFQGTDLIIFKDSYNGQLPLNGIKLADFNHTLQLFKDITGGKTKFALTGNRKFNETIINAIKILMTRRIGRELFKELIAKDQIPRITISPPASGSHGTETSASHAHYASGEIFIDLNETGDISIPSPNGERRRIETKSPLIILLGHELAHFLSSERPDLNEPRENWTNLSEQLTITGLTKPILFSTELRESDFQDINENSLRAAFGLGYRVSHNMTETIPSRENILKLPFEEAFLTLLTVGLMSEAEALLNAHPEESNQRIGGLNLWQQTLLTACSFDNVASFRRLLARGTDYHFSIPTPQGSNAELCQVLALTGSGKILKYLLALPEMRGKVNIQDTNGNSMLHLTLLEEGNKPPEGLRSSSASRINKLIQILVEAGTNPAMKNSVGDTPLHIAARRGLKDAIVPLALAATINERNNAGLTPLQVSIAENHLDCTAHLIANGADVNLRTASGDTIFLDALRTGSVRLIRLLLTARNVDKTLRSHDGLVALDLLRTNPNINPAELNQLAQRLQ